MSTSVTIEHVRDALPEAAKDIKLNLQSALGRGSLTEDLRWGVVIEAARSKGRASVA